MKKLFLVRGLPGAGKSTVAKEICTAVISADDYFTEPDGTYRFNPAFLKDAHEDCRMRTGVAMDFGIDVAVANTFTQEWEMDSYYELAEHYGYTVFAIVVENRHEGVSVHNVPEKAVKSMRNRFQVSL